MKAFDQTFLRKEQPGQAAGSKKVTMKNSLLHATGQYKENNKLVKLQGPTRHVHSNFAKYHQLNELVSSWRL